MESHPECWHRETPRSPRSAHRVTPQLLVHTSRCTQHNRITQVVIWLADCPPPGVMGRHGVSAIHNSITARSRDARHLPLADKYVCWRVFGEREGDVGNTLQTHEARETVVEENTAADEKSTCYAAPLGLKTILWYFWNRISGPFLQFLCLFHVNEWWPF